MGGFIVRRGVVLCDNADNNKEDAVNYAMSLDRKMTIAEAKESNLTEVSLKDAAGHICGEYIYIYPPGIPLVVPGETLSKEVLQEIEKAVALNLNIKGLINKGKDGYQIPVVKEKSWLSVDKFIKR